MLRRLGRTSLALLLCSTIAAGAAFAQGFHAVHSPDGTGVWAVGDGGVVYFSADAGGTYMSLTVGASTLRGVAAAGLNVIAIGDAGRIYRSTSLGGTWALQTLGGSPDLRAIELASATTGWLAGAAGTIQKTTDAGASWSPQTSGVAVTLRALRFIDISNGWAVGDAGTVLRTTDGGANWTPVAVPTTNRLLTVDQQGTRVWIAGEGGACLRSTDGGASFSHVNLKLDSGSDVRAVRLATNDTVFVAGGGGFVRRSVNDGATWTFTTHTLHSRLTGFAKFGSRLFMCSDRHRTVFRTMNAGVTWTMPVLATHSKTFVQKNTATGPIRGGTIDQHPANPHAFYAVSGNRVIKSLNDGDTWAPIDTIPGVSYGNAFIVSHKDSTHWVAAMRPSGGASRIMRTTDGGLNWTTPLTKAFGEYGIPLEQHPDRPDTIYFGADLDTLMASHDFGASWFTLPMDSAFRSPCDIVVVPDSSNIILVGDGQTGNVNPPAQYYRSTDGGVTFELMASRTGFSGASEIPGMACARLQNNRVLGTNWLNGGVQLSTNYGATWPNTGLSTGTPFWGTDIARDDPNFVMAGVYSTPDYHFSIDGGASWSTFGVPGGLFGLNNSYYARDREVVLAEQSSGIWKLQGTYNYTPITAQSVAFLAPAGGEVCVAGSPFTVIWNQENLAVARFEYRTSPSDPWIFVADVPGYYRRYQWIVPGDLTSEASLRISDAWDGAPSDQSAEFSIVIPLAAADPVSLDFGTHAKGTVTTLSVTIENAGSGPVAIQSVTATNGAFTEGRGSFSIQPGESDSIGVSFRPQAGVNFAATLEIVSNAYGTPLISIPLTGSGLAPLYAATPAPVDLGVHNPGATAKDTLRFDNAGNAPLTISNIVSSHPEFFVSRTALVVPAGGSDTVRVFYQPLGSGLDTTTFSITASDTLVPHAVLAVGEARANVAVEAGPPLAFALLQNQPNPFGGSTQIRYALPVAARVELEVFDLTGQRVAVLVDGWQEPGQHTASFGAGARVAGGRRLGTLHSGVYFYRLTAGEFRSTRKMLFVR